MVIPVLTPHYVMVQRNQICAGVTRGKSLVVLVNQNKAAAVAMVDVSGRRRWSKRDEWPGSGAGKIAGPRAEGKHHAFAADQ